MRYYYRQRLLFLFLTYTPLFLAATPLSEALSALHNANIISDLPILDGLGPKQAAAEAKRAISSAEAAGKSAMLNASGHYQAMLAALSATPANQAAFATASTALLAQSKASRDIIQINAESLFDPYESMADIIKRKVLFVSDDEFDPDAEDGPLDTAFGAYHLLQKPFVQEQLSIHGADFVTLFKKLLTVEQTAADATTIGDAMRQLDRIAETEKEAALFVNELAVRFRKSFILDKDLKLPPAPPEKPARDAFHSAAQQAFKDRLYGADYEPTRTAINDTVERLKVHIPQADFNPQVAADEKARKRKIRKELLASLEPIFRRGKFAEKIRTQARMSGDDPEELYHRSVQFIEDVEFSKAELSSGRTKEHMLTQIKEVKKEYDEHLQERKKVRAATTPEFILPLVVNPNNDNGLLSYKDYSRFILPSEHSLKGSDTNKAIPGSVRLRGKQVPTFTLATPNHVTQWKTLYGALSRGEITLDEQGTQPLSRADYRKHEHGTLFIKQTQNNGTKEHHWYEPLRPDEQHLLTNGLFVLGERHANREHLVPVVNTEHLEELRSIGAEPYAGNRKALEYAKEAIEYTRSEDPHNRFRRLSDGSLVSATSLPIISIGRYPNFARKMGILGLDIGVHSMLHRSFHTAHIDAVKKKVLRNPLQFSKLVRTGTPHQITTYLRSITNNPFKSPHLLHLVGYAAMAESMHWIKKASSYDTLTTLKHRFDHFMQPAITEMLKRQNINGLFDYLKNEHLYHPMRAATPLPLATLIDWSASGRATPLSPLNSIFSFFVDDTADLESIRNLRGIVAAGMGGDMLANAKTLRPGFYSSKAFQFMRRLLISFFTLRYLDGNYARSLTRACTKNKKELLGLLKSYSSGAPHERSITQQKINEFIAAHSTLTGGSLVSKLLRHLRLPGAQRFTQDAQVLFASKVKASLMVNALLAIPGIAKMMYLPIKKTFRH